MVQPSLIVLQPSLIVLSLCLSLVSLCFSLVSFCFSLASLCFSLVSLWLDSSWLVHLMAAHLGLVAVHLHLMADHFDLMAVHPSTCKNPETQPIHKRHKPSIFTTSGRWSAIWVRCVSGLGRVFCEYYVRGSGPGPSDLTAPYLDLTTPSPRLRLLE